MRSSDFRKLVVWQKAMVLATNVYAISKSLPKDESFALSVQMRKAAVSMPSNIAEGQGRNSDKEFINFISIARGSLWELSTQIELCERLNYISTTQKDETDSLITEVSKMLNALANSLSNKIKA